MVNPSQFANGLFEISDELKLIYDEHLGDHSELLLHLFVGDVLRFSLKRLQVFGAKDITLVKLLDYVERSYLAAD